LVGAQELERSLDHRVPSVGGSREALVVLVFCRERLGELLVGLEPLVAREHQLLAVAPQVRGVVVVRLSLAEISDETVEALLERVPRRVWPAVAPFAEGASRIARFLKQPSDGDGAGGERVLALRVILAPAAVLPVLADDRVAGVLAGQQHAA
jgi:hypothetical protein